jgi:hypothetical protein
MKQQILTYVYISLTNVLINVTNVLFLRPLISLILIFVVMREILFLVFFTVHTVGSATNYYVSNSGNDSHDGKTIHTAWQTLKNVNSQTFLPGDSILFERGGVWYENLKITSSGSSNGQIIYGVYGDENGNKPVISGMQEVKGFNNKSNWQSHGNNKWSISHPGLGDMRVFRDGIEITRLYGSTIVTKENPWYYDKRLFLYSEDNPSLSLTSLKTSSNQSFLYHSGDITNINYITLQNLNVQGWRRTRLLGCSNWIIEYCDWGGYFGSVALLFNNSGSIRSENGIIRHCRFDALNNIAERFDVGVYNTTDAVNLYAGSRNWEIHDNYFAGWGHTALALRSFKNDPLTIEGIKVYNNYFTNKGMSYGRAIGGGMSVHHCNPKNPNEFFNNTIEDQAVTSQMAYPYAKIYNNIWNKTRGLNGDPTRSAYAVEFSGGTGRNSKYMEVYNNVFAYNGRRSVHIPGYPEHTVVEGLVFRNNIFYESDAPQFRAGNYGDNLLNGIVFENNIFYSSSAIKLIEVLGKTYTVAEFNAFKEGSHAFVTNGNIQADPLFVDPKNGDFRLKPESPAIGSGLTPLSKRDKDGYLWNNQPSIGPYEMNINKKESFSLIISAEGEGSVNVAPQLESFPAGTVVKLSAIPDREWQFFRWEGDIISEINETEIVIDGNMQVKAIFSNLITTSLVPEIGHNVNVYPNPAKEYFQITIDEPDFHPASFRIIDLSGRIMYEDVLNHGTARVMISSQFKAGIYFVEVLFKGKPLFSRRLMINNF